MHFEFTFFGWLTLYFWPLGGTVESSTPPRPAPESPWPVWEVWTSYLENCANALRQTDRQTDRDGDVPLYRYRYSLIIYLIGSSVDVLMIRRNWPKNEFSELYLVRRWPIYLEFATVAMFGVVLSCRVIAHGFYAIKQRRSRLVYADGWSWRRDWSHMHGFSANVRVYWPMNDSMIFVLWG